MSDLRLFIAAELPAEWRDALAETIATLRGVIPARLRWARPEGIHLTLKFLGEVDEARLPDLTAALTAAAAQAEPFTLTGGPLGAFGGAARPRVLWAGVGGATEALDKLARAVDGACRPLGFRPERQPFRPHLTLARVPDSVPAVEAARITGALTRVAPPSLPPFTVSTLTLVRSELGPGGARYTPLATTDLAAKS